MQYQISKLKKCRYEQRRIFVELSRCGIKEIDENKRDSRDRCRYQQSGHYSAVYFVYRLRFFGTFSFLYGADGDKDEEDAFKQAEETERVHMLGKTLHRAVCRRKHLIIFYKTAGIHVDDR